MIVADIKTRIKRTFGDEAQVQINDSDIVRWINDGQRFVVNNNDEILEKISYMSVVAGQQEYELPADLLTLRSINIKYPTGSFYSLQSADLIAFDKLIAGWDNVNQQSALPATFHVYAGNFRVWPIPSTDITNGWKLYYNRWPQEVTNDSDTIDLPVAYHNLIVNYCLQQAYELDEDWEARKEKSGQIQTDLTLARDREKWQRREVYPTITVLPEDR